MTQNIVQEITESSSYVVIPSRFQSPDDERWEHVYQTLCDLAREFKGLEGISELIEEVGAIFASEQNDSDRVYRLNISLTDEYKSALEAHGAQVHEEQPNGYVMQIKMFTTDQKAA